MKIDIQNNKVFIDGQEHLSAYQTAKKLGLNKDRIHHVIDKCPPKAGRKVNLSGAPLQTLYKTLPPKTLASRNFARLSFLPMTMVDHLEKHGINGADNSPEDITPKNISIEIDFDSMELIKNFDMQKHLKLILDDKPDSEDLSNLIDALMKLV